MDHSNIGIFLIEGFVFIALIGWFANLWKMISFAMKGGSGSITFVRFLGLAIFPLGVFLGLFIPNPHFRNRFDR